MAKQKKTEEEGTALAVIDASDYAPIEIGVQEILSLMDENLGGEELTLNDLPQVKMPSGGQLAWMVGDEPRKTLEGIILKVSKGRAYWPTSIDDVGPGQQPDCTSLDAITGIGAPGGDCVTCPLADWDSADKGGGQACTEFRDVFLLEPGQLLPMVIRVAPTSIATVRKFTVSAFSSQVNFRHIPVVLGLEEATNANGIKYGKMTITPQEMNGTVPQMIEAGQREAIVEYGRAMEAATTRQRRTLAAPAIDGDMEFEQPAE